MPQDLTDDKSTLVQVMAITWTSLDQDLQRHMASLGPNELIYFVFILYSFCLDMASKICELILQEWKHIDYKS